MSDLRAIAEKSNAWPFQEARRLLERFGGAAPEKGYVLFETGYGPSGLPHIGTFGEVVRTTMVRRAFETLSDVKTRLFAFSDDMDGLRKVPDNVPNQEMMAKYAERKDANGMVVRNGTPLTSVPDPFDPENFESFGAHNNARLRAFLDAFGFEYEFHSATKCYRSGQFDDVLRRVLERREAITEIVGRSLREQRRKTYSPFFPIISLPDSDLAQPRLQVLHNAIILEADVSNGTALFQELNVNGESVGKPFQHSILKGNCKLQWRVDWAMRWTALSVDYEMSGKDLIDSVKLGSEICRVIGGTPPINLTYELFLDENGEKISKSKGNGLSVEEWLEYAPPESLSYFMYQAPRRAKRLYFDVIPRQVDEYLGALEKFPTQDDTARLDNPVWHIHQGKPPTESVPLGFGLLMNLASVCNTEDKAVLWGFVGRYAKDARPENHPILDSLIGFALKYYRDFVKPTKKHRAPTENERWALEQLAEKLATLPKDAESEAFQNEVYAVGKELIVREPERDLRAWFQTLYEVLFGQTQGPRMGSFIALYGRDETIALIRKALAGEALA